MPSVERTRQEQRQRSDTRAIRAQMQKNELDNKLAQQRLANQGSLQNVNVEGQFGLAKQKLSDTAAFARAQLVGGVEKDVANINQQGATARQQAGDTAAMERTTAELANRTTLQNSQQGFLSEQTNRSLAGQLLLAGVPGEQAQPLMNATDIGGPANLAGIKVPTKQDATKAFEYIKPEHDLLTGKPVTDAAVLNTITGEVSPAAPAAKTYFSTLQGFGNDAGKQKEYLRALRIVDPAAYEELRGMVSGR